ncbi:MAG: DbpA RNA binding domain-containing protein, partial [Pseudomonadota bacterium]|nr:DbpA RNA binding domain-containing protein [Pseudomonadota bacterium]
GDLEQRERDEILVRFVNTSCSVLVATDVAARGLDITHLNAVINVDISRDTEVHVHRVGRTGRGAERGLAITLCTANEKKWAALIENYQNKPLTWSEAPLPNSASGTTLIAPMATLCVMGGKKDKIRPADILGAMTNAAIGLRKDQIGKINVFEFMTYVAVDQAVAKQVSIALGLGQIKGRGFKVRLVDDLPSDR